MGFAKRPTALGFPIRHKLIIGYPEGSTWGLGLGLEKKVEPCSEEAIEGLLYGFQIRDSQGMGKSRLQIFIQDTETQEIDLITTGFESENGSFTCFARSFCLGLTCSDFDFKKPILLNPSKGNPEKVTKAVFCRLFQGGKSLRTEWDSGIDCLKILEALSPNFPNVSLYPSSSEDGDETMSPIDSYVDPEPPKETISFDNLMARNNSCLKRLEWTQEQGRGYLVKTYNKRSRQLLSDQELIEFTEYLEGLVKSLDNSSDGDVPF